jgi:phosphomannomutase
VAEAEAAMAGQGRVLVRASGTEPLVRVMVEAAKAIKAIVLEALPLQVLRATVRIHLLHVLCLRVMKA